MQLGIDITSEPGDLYLVKRCTDYNSLSPSSVIGNYQFHVKKMMNLSDPQADSGEMFLQLVEEVLKYPIITHEYMDFAQLVTKYRQPALVIYCPKDHPEYETIKWEMFKARE